MQSSILARSIGHLGKGQLSREPGAAMFQGLRFRLTLWYCAVLGAALVLFSIAIYFTAQYFLLHPIEADVQGHAQAHVMKWLSGQSDACPFSIDSSSGPEMVTCFDQNGSLLPFQNTTGLSSAFLTNDLAKSALQDGSASDFVNAGGTTGQTYRYALVVPAPGGNGVLGVVVIGESVQPQQSALSLLLILLLSIGGLSMLGACLGGLFLSNRALAPARLAWINQQRFIADASHELRTPLTLLRADAEVLLRGRERLAEDDTFLLEDIVAEANHMSNLATNMLTLARLDNDAHHQEHEVVHLADIAREGTRRIHALVDQKEISIHLASSNTAVVIGDPTLLEQAVLVLLDNAIKYNHRSGHITVRTAVHEGQAILEVSDTGVGIPAEHLPYLGERFYRVDKSRSREAGGTGLGLSIARSIALAHAGQLTFTSIPEQGTTVTLTLPLAYGTLSAGSKDQAISISTGSARGLPPLAREDSIGKRH